MIRGPLGMFIGTGRILIQPVFEKNRALKNEGHTPSADLREGEENIINPCMQLFAV